MSNTHNTSKAMKEDFVPFEIAKKLKEKGFKAECLAYYTTDINFFYNTTLNSYVITGFKSFNSNPNGICWKRIDAPTIAQALKWLREEKKIIVTIRYLRAEEGNWDFFAEGINGEIWYCPIISYKNYEESALAGIEYALNNLI